MSKVCPYQNREYIGYDEIEVESCPIQEHITEEVEICYYTNDYNECPIYVLQSQLQQRESIIKEIKEEMKKANHISVDDVYHIIEHEKKLNKILDKLGE